MSNSASTRASSDDAPGASLAPGTPGFQLWRKDALPEVWRRQPDNRQLQAAAANLGIPAASLQAYVALELPDTPWGRKYYWWAQACLDAMPRQESSDFLPVMLVSNFDYTGGGPQVAREACAELLQALLSSGRPPKHFSRVFGLRADEAGGSGVGTGR
jgi:hypothetical protein